MSTKTWACRDLTVRRLPPTNRRGYCAPEDGGHEVHFPEASVMLAFAMHLFSCGASFVTICPDGEHAKRFEIAEWLTQHGFSQEKQQGSTRYGGTYMRGSIRLDVYPRSGKYDVFGEIQGQMYSAECKGGS